jgi:hypothetical protein
MAFNPDELAQPQWMDVSFLTKILQIGQNNKFLKVCRLGLQVENYVIDFFRVH